MQSKKILIIGSTAGYSLETSYERAFRHHNWEVERFDIFNIINKSYPLSRLTGRFNNNIWQSILKSNITLSRMLFDMRPEILIVFCNAPISTGTLLFAKSLGIKSVLIWPDAISNIDQRYIENIKIYDLIASYSITNVESFKLLGGGKVIWLPLAGDDLMHGLPIKNDNFSYDISFIGNWRPERQIIVEFVYEAFPEKKYLIQGNGWLKHLKNKNLLKWIKDGVVTGEAYASALNASMINLNIIDHTNYPAANMRFFEIPTAGALQVSSLCSEMESIMRNEQHVFYYNDREELISVLKQIFANPKIAEKIRLDSRALIHTGHLYKHRAQEILNQLFEI